MSNRDNATFSSQTSKKKTDELQYATGCGGALAIDTNHVFVRVLGNAQFHCVPHGQRPARGDWVTAMPDGRSVRKTKGREGIGRNDGIGQTEITKDKTQRINPINPITHSRHSPLTRSRTPPFTKALIARLSSMHGGLIESTSRTWCTRPARVRTRRARVCLSTGRSNPHCCLRETA